jgi:hypothetical protein
MSGQQAPVFGSAAAATKPATNPMGLSFAPPAGTQPKNAFQLRRNMAERIAAAEAATQAAMAAQAAAKAGAPGPGIAMIAAGLAQKSPTGGARRIRRSKATRRTTVRKSKKSRKAKGKGRK